MPAGSRPPAGWPTTCAPGTTRPAPASGLRGLAHAGRRDLVRLCVERQFALERQAGAPAGRWLPDSAARLVWEHIVGATPPLQDWCRPACSVAAAYESWRPACTPTRSRPRSLPTGDTPGSGSVRALGRRVRGVAGPTGWLARITAVASLNAGCAAARALEFVGFDALTPAQQSYRRAAASDGRDVSPSTGGARAGLHASTCWVECKRSSRRTRDGGTLGCAATRASGRTSALPSSCPDLLAARDASAACIDACWFRPLR